MGKKLLAEADSCLDRKKRHRIWMKVVSILACLVVFCTTYALILRQLLWNMPHVEWKNICIQRNVMNRLLYRRSESWCVRRNR